MADETPDHLLEREDSVTRSGEDTGMAEETPDRLLTIAQVVACSGLHRATIYRKVKEGTFPPPLQPTTRRVAWKSREVLRWQQSLPVGVKSIA